MKALAVRFVLPTLLLALCGAPLLAEDWPRFRGPTGQGISAETNLPTQWSATENIAWKTPIPGQGWSSPIVAGDRVFVTTAADNGISCRVLCLDRKTGQILWNKEVFQQTLKRKEGKNSFATPTPVTDGSLVYAVFCDGSIAALDFAGNIVWTYREYKYYSQHGLGNSPILYENLLIMCYDPSNETGDKQVGWKIPWDKALLLALDKKTGQEKWRGKRGLSRIAHVTPVIIRDNDKPLMISAAGDTVQAHDPNTGDLIWRIYGQGEGLVPSPVVGDGLVFSPSGFEKPTIRAIRLGGVGDVTKTHIAWEQTAHVPMLSSFVFANHLLFTIKEDGFAMCLDPKTGKPLWQQRIGGNHCASPIFADGRIYFLSEQGESTIIEAVPEFKLIAKNSINETCQASFAVSQKQLFIRSDRNLFCIGK